MSRTIMIAANTGWNLVNFRSGIIKAARDRGIAVVAAVPPDPMATEQLTAMGCVVEPVSLDSVGLSPTRDLRTLFEFTRLMQRYRPTHYLSWTPKPNVYGSIAARLTGVRAVLNISGLGSVFIGDSVLTRFVKLLYRNAFSSAERIFFQNSTDREEFLRAQLARADQAVVLPGSGIDLDHFRPRPDVPREDDRIVFLLIARLLRDKGVEEFVAAAAQLRRSGMRARFQMLGAVGVANPTAIERAQLDQWVADGDVDYLGEADDVRPFIAAADCIVLPSYREGTARVLLEAGAMGKPVVATDVPGCRDPVDHGVTGLLCQVRSGPSLAAAMTSVAAMSPEARYSMGRAGRAKMEREYDQRIVVEQYMRAIGA